jgi:RNA polymerase sigma-54 factor
MVEMGLTTKLKTRTAARIRGRMKLARLMEMPEAELAGLALRLEASPLFRSLADSKIIMPAAVPQARIAARRFAGYGLRLAGAGMPGLADGDCEVVRLMRRIGQDRFEKWFLRSEGSGDRDRAEGCGISTEDARKLGDFMDRAFIQGEFEGPGPAAPAKVFSPVAGIDLQDGKPALAFFHREVWKRRYRIDDDRLAEHLRALPPAEAEKARRLVKRLRLLEQRKTTLYRLLEEVLEAQAEYLRTGDPAERRPLTQRALAAGLGTAPSVLSRLISNKSVQLPWGLEAPLALLCPSAKSVHREHVRALACANPNWRDEELRRELERRHGAKLSRRSIAQYRKDLSLGGRHRR